MMSLLTLLAGLLKTIHIKIWKLLIKTDRMIANNTEKLHRVMKLFGSDLEDNLSRL